MCTILPSLHNLISGRHDIALYFPARAPSARAPRVHSLDLDLVYSTCNTCVHHPDFAYVCIDNRQYYVQVIADVVLDREFSGEWSISKHRSACYITVCGIALCTLRRKLAYRLALSRACVWLLKVGTMSKAFFWLKGSLTYKSLSLSPRDPSSLSLLCMLVY